MALNDVVCFNTRYERDCKINSVREREIKVTFFLLFNLSWAVFQYVVQISFDLATYSKGSFFIQYMNKFSIDFDQTLEVFC